MPSDTYPAAQGLGRSNLHPALPGTKSVSAKNRHRKQVTVNLDSYRCNELRQLLLSVPSCALQEVGGGQAVPYLKCALTHQLKKFADALLEWNGIEPRKFRNNDADLKRTFLKIFSHENAPSFLSQPRLEPPQLSDRFNSLPVETLLQIAQFLPWNERRVCRAICKNVNAVFRHPFLLDYMSFAHLLKPLHTRRGRITYPTVNKIEDTITNILKTQDHSYVQQLDLSLIPVSQGLLQLVTASLPRVNYINLFKAYSHPKYNEQFQLPPFDNDALIAKFLFNKIPQLQLCTLPTGIVIARSQVHEFFP